MLAPFKRLTALHWSWAHAKLALGVWAVLLMIFTPARVASSWGVFLTCAIGFITISGCVISIVGLVLSAPAKGDVLPSRRTLRGLTVELFGLWWMMLGGLGAYTLTQFGLSFQADGDQRIALTAFAYSHISFVIPRIAMVTHNRRKGRRVQAVRGAQ